MGSRRLGFALRISAALAPVSALGAAAPPQAAPRLHEIVIKDMKFGAVPEEIRRGDTILWINRDMFRHSATAADRSFDLDLPPGRSARIRVARAGAIMFACRYHPGMTGQLRVGG